MRRICGICVSIMAIILWELLGAEEIPERAYRIGLQFGLGRPASQIVSFA
jgi:hypothetical protein